MPNGELIPRGILLDVSRKALQRPGAVSLITPEQRAELIPIPPLVSVSGSPFARSISQFVGPALGLVSPGAGAVVSTAISTQPRREVPVPSFFVQSLQRRAATMPNGLSGALEGLTDFLPDIDYGAIFTQGVQQIGLPLLRQELLGQQGTVTALAPSSQLGVRTGVAMLPAIRQAGGMLVGSLARRFPNLAAALQAMRDAGIGVTRTRAWSLLRTYGPSVLLGFGAAWTEEAIRELLIAGPGRRRMNPANVKALRRAIRRAESFHKLCRRADVLSSKRRGRTRRAGTCAVCNATPCRC